MRDILAVAIMHKPGAREELLGNLLDTLGEAPRTVVRVVDDPRPPGSPPAAWPTAQAAWHWLMETNAEHGLILQDDTIACANFLRAATICVRAAGGPVSFWSRRSRQVAAARQAGADWAIVPGRACGYSMHLPQGQIPKFLEWVAWREEHFSPPTIKASQPWRHHDDIRLMHWFKMTGQKVWTTIPSLVEHGAPEASLLGQSNRTRVATYYIGDGNPLLIDWKARRSVDVNFE